VTGRREKRHKQLLDVLKEEKRYWKLEGDTLARTLWGTRFGTDYGPVVRQTTELIISSLTYINQNLHKAHDVTAMPTLKCYCQSSASLVKMWIAISVYFPKPVPVS
jgi:hypothetical protein